MHIEPGLLLLPYNNAWSQKSVTSKATLSACLLLAATSPLPAACPIAAGLLAAVLATRAAGIRLHTWAELLAAPLLFAAAAGLPLALRGPEGISAALLGLARVFGAASATLLLATTTPLLDIVALFQRRSGLRTLTELFLLSYRAAVAIASAGLSMTIAIRLRGLGGRWRTAPHTYAAFASALAIRSLESARRSEAGLAIRGFHGHLPLFPPEASR